MITVTYLSPLRVCRHTCSSTPRTRTPSKRFGSLIRTRLPSASTALLAVFQTPRGPRRPGPWSGAGPRSLPTPTAIHAATASLAVRPPAWCLGATHDNSPCTGSGARRSPSTVGRHPSGSCAKRHVVTGDPLAATAPAPAISSDDPAREHRPIGLDPLPDRYQAELIKPAERGQVAAKVLWDTSRSFKWTA